MVPRSWAAPKAHTQCSWFPHPLDLPQTCRAFPPIFPDSKNSTEALMLKCSLFRLLYKIQDLRYIAASRYSNLQRGDQREECICASVASVHM